MDKEKKSAYKHDFDYEEDYYDRLKNTSKTSSRYKAFTNKATMKKVEFDYEEDAYEPEKSK